MKKYNIAYIFTPIEFGGAERVNLTFLKHLDQDRFCVTPILLIRPWEEKNRLMKELEDAGYTFHAIPVAQQPKSQGRDYFRVFRCLRMVYSLLKDHSFDLVHSHGYFADIVGIPPATVLGIPRISTCHGFISTDRKLRIYNMLDRTALRLSDRIIAVSDAMEHELLQSGMKRSRVVCIQNAVAAMDSGERHNQNRKAKRKQLGLAEHEFLIGYVGRLSKEKGLIYLLEATRLLHRSGLLVKLVLIGEGPQRQELNDFVVRKNLTRDVVFTGFQEDVTQWLPAVDTFVLPSLTEGTPLALLEAMAFGVPAVASAVGGVPRVIEPGVTGILVSPGSAGEIKDALHLLYTDEALRTRLSIQARQKITDHHNVKDWIKKIETEYVNTINRDQSCDPKSHTVKYEQ